LAALAKMRDALARGTEAKFLKMATPYPARRGHVRGASRRTARAAGWRAP